MLTVFQPVDGPSITLEGLVFDAPVSVVAQPVTYGRVLFTSHGTIIRNCIFPVGPTPLLSIDGAMRGMLIESCQFLSPS